MRYAEGTAVSQGKSVEEIEKTIKRYGASGFSYGWQEDKAVVGFKMKGRLIRFLIVMPGRSTVSKTETGRTRSSSQIQIELEKATRQCWRALALVIKAKLEAVESGITTFEDEFMAHIVLPDGQTVGDHMRPQIASAYESGKMPALLPFHGNDRT